MKTRKLLVATALLTGSLLACADEEEAIGNPKGCWYDDGGYPQGLDCPDAPRALDAAGDAAADGPGDTDAATDGGLDATPDAAVDPTDASP